MNGTTSSKTLINLFKGHPNPTLLPTSQIKAASVAAFSDLDVLHSGLSYGPDLGYEPLRQHLATFLTQFYSPHKPTSPKRICVTGGASQNLACVLQVFSDPVFTKVWMVSPVYYLACRVFEDHGFHSRMRAVPEDEEGINITFLREELQRSDEKENAQGNVRPYHKAPLSSGKIYRHIIYAVPTFSNPSSMTMSLQRREQLVKIARDHDALIITDDVYDYLQWPIQKTNGFSSLKQAILPRIVDVDKSLDGGCERDGADGFGNAVSNGSFSKIAGPGCRTGWAEGTEKFVLGLSQTGSTMSGGAPSQLTATIMTSLLESGDLQQHIFRTLQPAYQKRYHLMVGAIEEHLVPLGVSLPPSGKIAGGYFIWISLPYPLRATDVAAKAKEDERLIVKEGSSFGVWGDSEGQGLEGKIRLTFSLEEEGHIVDGIARLGNVIYSMQQSSEESCDRDAFIFVSSMGGY